ncbi:hypothetical protein ACHAXN_008675 [Cyclotella atomus]
MIKRMNKSMRQKRSFKLLAVAYGLQMTNLQYVASQDVAIAAPAPSPTSPALQTFEFDTATGCSSDETKVTVEVKADRFSNDTSWQLVDYYTGKKFMSQRGYTLQPNEYRSKDICLTDGLYNFTIWDEYGDGICCRYGEGFFKVSFDDDVVLAGGSFNANVSEVLNIGYKPKNNMVSTREKKYLTAHNRRRKKWYAKYNLTDAPMKYSPELAKTAKAWANELLNACGVVGIEHEDYNPFGENLAKNLGNRSTFGQLYPVENIVGRWVEFEVGLPYPSNGHLTQALWRASRYLGCGEAAKPYRGGMCRVQVCRYGRAGNCDMAGFDAKEGENWLVPMLMDVTRCGPNCPPEGCF